MGDLNISRTTKKLLVGCNLFVIILGGLLSYLGILGQEGAHYFAYRRNLLNVLFVKQGWLWFTIAFWTAFASRRDKQRAVVSSAFRWAGATAWWLLFAQWLMGPPLMDRLFTATGGSCVVDNLNIDVNSSKACRSDGGVWLGGHDPSGHVFLLTLSSIVVFMELVPSLSELGTLGGREFLRVHKKACVSLFVQATNYFLLFLTCVYFHSFFERVSGFLFALVEIYFVYFMGETYKWGKLFGTDDTGVVFEIDLSSFSSTRVSTESALNVKDEDMNVINEDETTTTTTTTTLRGLDQ